MAAQGGQDQGAEKNVYYIFWLLVLLVIATAIIWHYFHHQLKLMFIFVRFIEFQVVYFVLNLVPEIIPLIGAPIHDLALDAKAYLDTVKQLTPGGLNPQIAEVLSNAAGSYLRYPLVIYLAFLSYVVFKRSVRIRLKKKFNMKTLAAQEQKIWPQIQIVETVDLLKEDLDLGPWAMAMTPMQFAKKNQLVVVELNDLSKSKFSKIRLPDYKATLNRPRAARAFSVQIGRTWRGIEHMPAHRRAIFAIFAARGLRDNKSATAMVAQLASSAAKGLDCSGGDELWKKHIKNERLQKIMSGHAYELTLFISMVLFAREDGVVPSSDFLWVKPMDRRLWYTINNVGRQTPGVEVGGVFSHWYYEMALGRSLSAPRVDEAVVALELALGDVIYAPSDEEKQEIAKRHEAKQEHP